MGTQNRINYKGIRDLRAGVGRAKKFTRRKLQVKNSQNLKKACKAPYMRSL